MVFEEVETVADSRDPLGTFTRYFSAIADNVVDLPTERIGVTEGMETFGAVVCEAGTTVVEVVIGVRTTTVVGVELDMPVTDAVEVTNPDRDDSIVSAADWDTPNPSAVTTAPSIDAFPVRTRYVQSAS